MKRERRFSDTTENRIRLANAREERHQHVQEIERLCDLSDEQERCLTKSESRKFARAEEEMSRLDREISALESELGWDGTAGPPATRWDGERYDARGRQLDRNSAGTSTVLLGAEQRITPAFAELGVFGSDHDEDEERSFSLGAAVRGLVTGHWDGAEPERRALSIATAGAGGHLLPAPISSGVIDRVRNVARVFEAGALTVPMEQNTLALPRLTTGVTGAWRNENTAVAESDPVFDRVNLQARTLSVMTRLSYELFQDLTSAGAEIIEREIVAALALELDRVALRGSGVAPEPRGILNTAGVTTIANGANGTAFSYAQLVNLLATVQAAGFDPNAVITNPRALKSAALLVDSTGQPLVAPKLVTDVPILPTRQVPINLAVGSSSDTSEAYAGQWDQLVVGFRPMVSIEVDGGRGPSGMVGVKTSDERFMDTMQVAILAFLRADVALLHPEAFAVSVGIRP